MEQEISISKKRISRRFSQIEEADFRRISVNLRLQSAKICGKPIYKQSIKIAPLELLKNQK